VDFSPTWALNDPMHFTAELDLINNTYTLTIDNSFHSNAVFADARSDTLAGFDLIIFRDTGGLGGALQTFEVGIDNFFTPGPPVPFEVGSSVDTVDDVANLEFQSIDGDTYRLECTTSLPGGGWAPIGALVTGDGEMMTLNDPTGGSGTKSYRIVRNP
jgi:hypothetical protein